MSPALSQPLTLNEYLNYQDGTENRYELVNGSLVEMPPESDENLSIARSLLLELAKHVPSDLLAWGTEIEVTGQRATCRVPDLLVHTAESKAALAGMGRATLTRDMPPPALVVEVVSPGQQSRDRDYRFKHTEYAARGIAEYWIIDPEWGQVTVCRWEQGMYEDQTFQGHESLVSALIPSFSLTPAQILGVGQQLGDDEVRGLSFEV